MQINLSWEEDIEDILGWCQENSIKVNHVSAMDLADLDSSEFFKVPAFTSTEVVSKHLQEIGFKIIDTYDEKFAGLYGRKIWRGLPTKFPVFVKPVANDKAFDGTVVSSEEDLHEHLERYDLEISSVKEFYLSEVVKFEKEQRILIGNGKVYNNLNDPPGRQGDWIDKDFISELVERAGREFYTIDVGLVAGKWCIVEINPPYSIDSYEIAIGEYMNFCLDFFANLKF